MAKLRRKNSEEAETWRMALLLRGSRGPEEDPEALDEEPAPPRKLLGYMVYKKWGPPLRCFTVLRLAVLRSLRGRGLGRQLLTWLLNMARCSSQGQNSAVGKVALSSLSPAVGFYESLGFREAPRMAGLPLWR